METASTTPSASQAATEGASDETVVLADGTVRTLDGLPPDDLLALQWEQERAFAAMILAAPKGSEDRARATCQAYDTVTRILAASRDRHEPLIMGMHSRHERLVLDRLARQRRRGQEPRFFEIGYGAGALLQRVRDTGFAFAGIEVSASMREMALERLGREHGSTLYLGHFMEAEAPPADGPWSLVYWNDVFEHVPPDEIGDWLQRIHRMLAPGGQLITITPNWHVRPSDVTAAVCPPRTEAVGVHLKEYTLGEVSRLLRRAGFQRVAAPLLVTPGRLVFCGSGLLGPKRFFEPTLEWLPFPLTRLLCRGMGLSCTIATKAAG